MTGVTIVVCTWNRVGLLERTLRQFESLRAPEGLDWEVLVVDNNSSDDTPHFLSRFRPSYRFRCLHEPQPGQSSALNLALSRSATDLNLLTDDDVLVEEDWLTEFWAGARRHPDATVFGGPIDPWFVEEPDPDLLEVFPMLKRGFAGVDYGTEECLLAEGSEVVGANMALRLSKLNGLAFRADLGPTGRANVNGGETELQQRIRRSGGAVVWLPRMRLKHYVDPKRMTLDYLMQFSEDWGRAMIRRNGVPQVSSIAGAPRWLYRQVLGHYAREWREAIRGRRIPSLEQRRKRRELMGMIKECRAQRSAGRSPGQ